MEEKKTPRLPVWVKLIVTATMVIQLLNIIQYYQAWNQFQDLVELQNSILEYRVENLKTINQIEKDTP